MTYLRIAGALWLLVGLGCKRTPPAAVADADAAPPVASAVDSGPERDGLADELAALEALADAATDGPSDVTFATHLDLRFGAAKAVAGSTLPENAQKSLDVSRFKLRRCLAKADAKPRAYTATIVVKEGGEVSTVMLLETKDAGAALPALEECLFKALLTDVFESPDGGIARLTVTLKVD